MKDLARQGTVYQFPHPLIRPHLVRYAATGATPTVVRGRRHIIGQTIEAIFVFRMLCYGAWNLSVERYSLGLLLLSLLIVQMAGLITRSVAARLVALNLIVIFFIYDIISSPYTDERWVGRLVGVGMVSVGIFCALSENRHN